MNGIRASLAAGRVPLLLVLAPLAFAAVTSIATADAPLVDALQSGEIAPEAGRTISDLTLTVGPATLTLHEGTLFPSARVGTKTVRFVFIGSGRLESPAPDDIEAGQLELFTGRDRLDLEFEEAVLLAAGDAVAAALSEAGSEPEATALFSTRAERARERVTLWKESSERKLLAPEPALFLDANGDKLMDGYFVAWLAGGAEGDVVFSVDPRQEEALTVTHFVPDELEGVALRERSRALGREHRRGRMLDLELEDLGALDVWMSHAVAPPRGVEWPAREAFEPRHVDLDVRLSRSDAWLQGNATLDLEATADGRRGLSLGLMADLTVTSVRTDDGTPLPFHQQRSDVAVSLPADSVSGTKLKLNVEYEGNPIARVKHRTFALLGTWSWYPRIGEIDRATYDVTFHIPGGLDLLAPGTRVEESKEEDGSQRIHYTLDHPVQEFSFEIGDFVVKEEQVGDVLVRVAFDRESANFPAKVKREIQETVSNSLRLFQELFGDYPLQTLTVVLTPRPFSQGFAGFVTLSHDQVSSHGGWRGLFWWLPDRRVFISHEIAHQWWGDLVGWKSYRDQWLSEALAMYSAETYMRHQTDGQSDPEKGAFLGWTDALLDVTEGGRVVESLGPVVLGSRLDSSRYDAGYFPIVYQKGGMIMDLLARYAGQEAFTKMLSQLALAARDSDLSTEEFVRAMERMLGRSLDWFEERWVRGTGLPIVDYTYGFEPAPGGGWKVSMEARQRTAYYSRYRVVRTERDGWDLERTSEAAVPVKASVLPVEFQVLTEGEGRRGQEGRLERYGTVVLQGSSSSFHLTVPTQPIRAWLDRRGVAPAIFRCESCEPKRTHLLRGADLATAGDWEAAENELRSALEEPVFVPAERGEGPTKAYLALRGRNLDGLAHLQLASMYLDQGRDEDGSAAFEEAMRTMDRTGRWEVQDMLSEIPTGPGADRSMYDPALWHRRPQQWSALDLIDQVESRLEVRRGEYVAAYERLSKRLVVAQKSTHLATRYVPRMRERSAPSQALLAIAASELGRFEEAREAMADAEDGGVDISALEDWIGAQTVAQDDH